MEIRSIFVLIFFQLLLGKIGSTLNQADDLSIEGTVVFLKDKMTRMEQRMSSFELSLAVQDSRKGSLEDKKEILEKVSEVEMRCEYISAKLQDAEVRFLKMDTHLLVEIQEARETSAEALERVRIAEQEVARVLESKIDISEVKKDDTREVLNSFVASQRDTNNVIRKNISSSTEKLMHLNDSLSSRFESLTTKMRIFENTLSEIEKDYANVSFVSKLDKSFQDLDKAIKTDIESIQSERVKHLEERCALCDGVVQLNETLRSHSSQITALNASLLDIQTSCPDPPSVENGYPLLRNKRNHDRKNGATVLYACHGNRTLVGSGGMVCRSGEWTGDIPACMNSCNTENLKGYNGLDIPKNKTTEHSKSLGIRCRGGYVLSSTSESLTCLNGTWNVSGDPCTKQGVFDATTYLWAWTGWDWYYCYSKNNSEKIEFSRVLDTGSGPDLPLRLTKSASTGYALFRFGMDTRRGGGPFGAFQCTFDDELGSTSVVVPRQDVSSDLHFMDPFRVANIGDPVDLQVNFNKAYSIRWKHNGVDVPSWNNKEKVQIPSVQPTDAGMYECYYQGKRGVQASALLRMIVRKCKKNLFGKHCDQQCPPCYNGGICHDHLGVCVCPPGFIGNNCEVACGRGRHGADCSRACSYTDCHTALFCQPDPYGCSCAPGVKGIHCNEPCAPGWYGASCKQLCHCAGGSCDRHTGACSAGCSAGWTGPSCQIQGR